MKIVLCICTCQRPDGLTRLLQAVAKVEYDDSLSLVVVDNDVAGEGIKACEEIAPDYRWPLRWCLEEQRGIPHARNTAVALAMESEPDFIAMLDDDEEPSAEWLYNLVDIQQRTDADAVFGPVVPRFKAEPPDWALRGRFFERRRSPDGTARSVGATNNCLVRSACFERLKPIPFNLDFALTGGSDSEFFTNLRRLGYVFVWSDHAVVSETLPKSRVSKSWLRQRAYRGGQVTMRIDRIYHSSRRAELDRFIRTVCRFVIGCALWIGGFFDEIIRLKGELMIATAIGKLSVYFGIRYHEYAKIHK